MNEAQKKLVEQRLAELKDWLPTYEAHAKRSQDAFIKDATTVSEVKAEIAALEESGTE